MIVLTLLSLAACNSIERSYVPSKEDSPSTITSSLGEQFDSGSTTQTYSPNNVKQIPQIIEIESNAQAYPSTTIKHIPILNFSTDNNEGSYR